MIGLHIALKNYNNMNEYQLKKIGKVVSRGDKLGLLVVPMFCFIGGSINLYLAVNILRNYRQEREVWQVLN